MFELPNDGGRRWELVDVQNLARVNEVTLGADGKVSFYCRTVVVVMGCRTADYEGATPKEKRDAALKEIGGQLLRCGNFTAWSDHYDDHPVLRANIAFGTEDEARRALSLDGLEHPGGRLCVRPRIYQVGSRCRIRRVDLDTWSPPSEIRATLTAKRIKNLCQDHTLITTPPELFLATSPIRSEGYNPALHPIPSQWKIGSYDLALDPSTRPETRVEHDAFGPVIERKSGLSWRSDGTYNFNTLEEKEESIAWLHHHYHANDSQHSASLGPLPSWPDVLDYTALLLPAEQTPAVISDAQKLRAQRTALRAQGVPAERLFWGAGYRPQ